MNIKENDIEITAANFQKLFSLQAVEKITYESLLQALSEYINKMINKDFAGLIQLLYKMDIDESNLRLLLQQRDSDAGNVIAKMLIERELQKIESRRSFERKDGIDDEERW